MERLDSQDLTPHLEAALMMAPKDTLKALADTDRYRRNMALGRLAEHIVSRLKGFEIIRCDVLADEVRQACLFDDSPMVSR